MSFKTRLVFNLTTFLIFIMCSFHLESQESLFLSLKQAEDLAVQNNYKINASLQRLEQGYYGYRASKDYFLPNVALTGTVNLASHQHNIDGALNLTKPLYDKVASYDLKGTQIQWEQLKLEVQQQMCDILFQVRQAYYELILNQTHLVVDQTITQIWEDELKRQKRSLELGVAIPYEVNQTQLHLKNAWIDFYATEKDSQASQVNLLTLLGLAPNTRIVLAETTIPLPPFNWQKSQLEQWKKIAYHYRPELRQELIAIQLAQNKVKQTKAENSPTVNLYANVGHGYINNGFSQKPVLGLGVNVDWSLYNSPNKQRIKQAQLGIQEATANYSQMQLETAAIIYNALNEIEQLYRSYLMAREGAILAEDGMEMANKKHQLGVMSAFEYRDAIKTLHEAQQAVNQAKFDLRNAYDKLVQQVGMDLDNQSLDTTCE